MGHASSHEIHAANDFELVIRSSKELEHLLDLRCGATGNGLGEKAHSAKLSNGEGLPRILMDRIHSLVKERNKLIHDVNYNEILNREAFISDYEASLKEILVLVKPVGHDHHGQHKRRCVVQ